MIIRVKTITGEEEEKEIGTTECRRLIIWHEQLPSYQPVRYFVKESDNYYIEELPITIRPQ